MSEKRQNNGVKRTTPTKNGALRGANVRLETALQRAVASVRQMSRNQRRQSLIHAGILTSAGKLAPTYR
jgi:hypothetical protein